MVSFAAPLSAMLPPPVPTPKRPSMSLKRDSSYLDTDDEAGLSVTTKKLKVAFDDHVDVRILDDWNDKSMDLVREEVKAGIEHHLAPGDQQNDTQYAKLLQTLGQDGFAGDAPSPRLLKKYIIGITERIPLLGECGKLVTAVLDLSWIGRDEEFVAIYTRFLVMLASTHSKFVGTMMDRLVAHFESLPSSTGKFPGEDPVPRSTMFSRIHSTIRRLHDASPASSKKLMSMLRHSFPTDLSSTKGYLQYQKHLLRLSDEVPELKAEIIAEIVQKLVNIDVSIQDDLEDLDDDEEESLLQGPQSRHLNDDDDADDDSDIDSISESELTTTEEEQKLKDLRLKVAKMDGTQDLLFEYYEPSFRADVSPRHNDAFQELLAQFESFIMRARSRHAQFLLFHFAQISPAYANAFVDYLLKLTIGNGQQNIRLTACAYLASFTARGSHLNSDIVQDVVGTLCRLLEEMRRRYEPSSTGPDRKSFSVYYAVAQALLYIFCFRWRDLVVHTAAADSDTEDMLEEDVLAEGRDLVWMSGLKETLTLNIHSRLNPLKVASSAIVGEFAKIANHLRFLYVFSILERNKRIRLGNVISYRSGGVDIGRRETAMDRKTGDEHHQLEAYFPFDPYHLPQSKRWLEGEYNEWVLPRGMKRDEEDEEDSDQEEDYESDEDDIPEDLTGQPLGMHAADAISVSD
ncbi:RNA polymerase I-specific transcription initiation factor rrn3 [Fulvia fulva]|uniref:RNA polymerase I-specific transcription initiation factor rrn3 n=1 Tax=Passalora fulva TaxID=5499 RepID=A0A9Q8LDB0_PASFU|nr:RNA polymerase I-specific transcription initiation factor rrn3 [Fulvia fulva]KAK4629729.1 RNA polymerase I-specific transcription initiation factor rrn3 [Fulvia fulva]KAK4630079.1 RNA polymerase I-specific transcription initiation factor rrn3 [Fulvia fulva]UJO15274.1 RNA polymerase I-specific transcription initiation factor rrn3 [Fulvia fulva]WPV12894.1 RNA polymerase I-specific transcription initiation factor rrn3 [Fulvia fulva]WPV27435.1 RNA polymerase I-specific transcription initiation 